MNRKSQNTLAILFVVAVLIGAAWYRRYQRVDTTASPVAMSAVGSTQAAGQHPPDKSRGEDVPASAPAVPTEVTQLAEPASDRPPAQKKLPRLVDLGANKCKQCKALAPILDALREEYKGRLSVEFIDVWQNPDAAEPYNIRLIPTQILYDRNGNELWRHEGFISKEDLKILFAEKAGVS
jgi:thioredoxin 1